MPNVTMKELLEAGVHFGHQTRRWNPKMKPYIYGERNDIYIIDLHKTRRKIDEAYNFVRDLAYSGGTLFFVGTKKQAQESMAEAAQRCGMYYVNQRWLGGMMTNFRTIRSRVDRLKELRKMEADYMLEVLPKKESTLLREEMDRLQKVLGGMVEMIRLPDAIFIVDLKKEHIAVTEARKLEIPIVGVVDTNCDPDEVDYVIPGNDDAIRAIRLMANLMSEAISEGRQLREAEQAKKEEERLAAEVAMAAAEAAARQAREDAEALQQAEQSASVIEEAAGNPGA